MNERALVVAPYPVVRIAVDAMGGDNAPEVVVRAIGLLTLTTRIQITLVGARAQLDELLRKVPYNAEQLHLVDAPESIQMHEHPREALEHKPGASILMAAREVAEGRADALVSAGNTGAGVLACARYFDRLPGVRRTALATVYPRLTRDEAQDRFALLLDVGATVGCTAEELVQFAIMGSAYASGVSKVRRPAVALLNMGTEAMKGDEARRRAYQRLHQMERIRFVGNVEGCDVPKDRADVIVTDGFTGNVVLKLLEGASEVMLDVGRHAYGQRLTWRMGMMLLRRGLRQLMHATDYANYGGAPVLGFSHLFIKCHGRSGPLAIENAIKVAAKAVRDDVCGSIARNLKAEGADLKSEGEGAEAPLGFGE